MKRMTNEEYLMIFLLVAWIGCGIWLFAHGGTVLRDRGWRDYAEANKQNLYNPNKPYEVPELERYQKGVMQADTSELKVTPIK